MTLDLAPGTLLRVKNMSLVARPGEAYGNPGKLEGAWQDLMQAGNFEDSLETKGMVEADILAFLGHSGSAHTLEAYRVASAITEIRGLQRKEVSEVQLKDGALRPELMATVASGEGVVVVQTVFKAKSMKITYRDARGASARVSLPKSDLPGTLTSGTSETSSGVEEYADAVLGYKTLFLAGGQGSSMTVATADELAKTVTADKGYKATAIGNLLLVEVTRSTAPQLSELTKAAVTRDQAKAAGDREGAEVIKREQTEMLRRMPSRVDLVRYRPRSLVPIESHP